MKGIPIKKIFFITECAFFKFCKKGRCGHSVVFLKSLYLPLIEIYGSGADIKFSFKGFFDFSCNSHIDLPLLERITQRYERCQNYWNKQRRDTVAKVFTYLHND